jgi:hypothetical protein
VRNEQCHALLGAHKPSSASEEDSKRWANVIIEKDEKQEAEVLCIVSRPQHTSGLLKIIAKLLT